MELLNLYPHPRVIFPYSGLKPQNPVSNSTKNILNLPKLDFTLMLRWCNVEKTGYHDFYHIVKYHLWWSIELHQIEKTHTISFSIYGRLSHNIVPSVSHMYQLLILTHILTMLQLDTDMGILFHFPKSFY